VKQILFIVRTAPYGTAASPESVRSCLGFAIMPVEVYYLLTGDGAWALQARSGPEPHRRAGCAGDDRRSGGPDRGRRLRRDRGPDAAGGGAGDAAARGIDVHVLAPDLAARGLHSDLAAVDYAGLVELLAAHERAVH